MHRLKCSRNISAILSQSTQPLNSLHLLIDFSIANTSKKSDIFSEKSFMQISIGNTLAF